MEGGKGYDVKVVSTERVVAALPLPEHWLTPTNFDLLLPPLDVIIFFCYKPNPTSEPFAQKVAALKDSLAKLLVTWYPLAGEIVATTSGEPELHCNNRGVDFIAAQANAELAELNLADMDESVVGKLVAKKTGGVFCVQVTEMKCGGVVIACTFEHCIADGYTTNLFMLAWGETTRTSKPSSILPSLRRSPLYPRRPGRYEPAIDRLYVPISELPPPPPPPANPEHAVNRMYYITAAAISGLQAAAKCSKLEALTAHLWVILAKAAKRRDAATVSMGVAVDGRSRLGKDKSLMRYFGNVLSVPYETLAVGELEGMELSKVAAVVHECIGVAATEEHFRGVADWVEARRPAPAGARIYFPGTEGVGDVAAVVSSGRGFPVADVEFPWGRAVFGSPLFLWEGATGHVMPMPSPGVDGDWVVYVHLLKGIADALEEEAGELLRPVTAAYLNLTAGV